MSNFNENQHPRGVDGKFTTRQAGAPAASLPEPATARAEHTPQGEARARLRQELEDIAAQGWADLPVWQDESNVPGPNIPGEQERNGRTHKLGLWAGDSGIAVMDRWYAPEFKDPDTYQAASDDDWDGAEYGDVDSRYVSVSTDTALRAEAAIRAFLREQEADGELNLPGGVDNYPILLATDSEEADK